MTAAVSVVHTGSGRVRFEIAGELRLIGVEVWDDAARTTVWAFASASLVAGAAGDQPHVRYTPGTLRGSFEYGTVPEGFAQTTPREGPPPPLAADRTYSICTVQHGPGVQFSFTGGAR